MSLGDEALRKVVNDILDFFDENIREKMAWLGSYVMDLVLLGLFLLQLMKTSELFLIF
jgi:hypothetical protein